MRVRATARTLIHAVLLVLVLVLYLLNVAGVYGSLLRDSLCLGRHRRTMEEEAIARPRIADEVTHCVEDILACRARARFGDVVGQKHDVARLEPLFFCVGSARAQRVARQEPGRSHAPMRKLRMFRASFTLASSTSCVPV
jgi:hypothetical protein